MRVLKRPNDMIIVPWKYSGAQVKERLKELTDKVVWEYIATTEQRWIKEHYPDLLDTRYSSLVVEYWKKGAVKIEGEFPIFPSVFAGKVLVGKENLPFDLAELIDVLLDYDENPLEDTKVLVRANEVLLPACKLGGYLNLWEEKPVEMSPKEEVIEKLLDLKQTLY